MAGKLSIPKEILQAKVSGNLIVFCGAGIARYLGFPTYKQLFDSTLDYFKTLLNLSEEEIDIILGINKSPDLEKIQKVTGLTREVLEDKVPHAFDNLVEFINARKKEQLRELDGAEDVNTHVRSNAVKMLYKDHLEDYKDNAPEIHAKIKEISKYDQHHSLITTNFDNIFVKVFSKTACIQYPQFISNQLAKNYYDKSVILLHGLAHETQKNEIILMQSDFEAMYFQTQNGSSSITRQIVDELFNISKKKIVLFLGYSLNDPFLKEYFEMYSKAAAEVIKENYKGLYVYFPEFEKESVEQRLGSATILGRYYYNATKETIGEDFPNFISELHSAMISFAPAQSNVTSTEELGEYGELR